MSDDRAPFRSQGISGGIPRASTSADAGDGDPAHHTHHHGHDCCHDHDGGDEPSAAEVGGAESNEGATNGLPSGAGSLADAEGGDDDLPPTAESEADFRALACAACLEAGIMVDDQNSEPLGVRSAAMGVESRLRLGGFWEEYKRSPRDRQARLIELFALSAEAFLFLESGVAVTDERSALLALLPRARPFIHDAWWWTRVRLEWEAMERVDSFDLVSFAEVTAGDPSGVRVGVDIHVQTDGDEAPIRRIISDTVLEDFGMPFEDMLAVARCNQRNEFVGCRGKWTPATDGLWIAQKSHVNDSNLTLFPDVIADGTGLSGDIAVMTVYRDMLLAVDPGNESALIAAYNIARKLMGMRKAPTITTAPLLWSGGQWSVFRPPINDGDLSRAHAEHLIRNVAERYETQRQMLTAVHDRNEVRNSVHISRLTVHKHEEGLGIFTMSMWLKGVDCLVPECDVVAFADPDRNASDGAAPVLSRAPFGEVVAALGLTRLSNTYPVRYHCPYYRFPKPEMMSAWANFEVASLSFGPVLVKNENNYEGPAPGGSAAAARGGGTRSETSDSAAAGDGDLPDLD